MVVGKGHDTAGSSSCHCSCQSQLHDRGGAMGQGCVKKLNVWLSRPNPEWFVGEGMKRSRILTCSTFCSHTFWTFDAYSRIKTIRLGHLHPLAPHPTSQIGAAAAAATLSLEDGARVVSCGNGWGCWKWTDTYEIIWVWGPGHLGNDKSKTPKLSKKIQEAHVIYHTHTQGLR